MPSLSPAATSALTDALLLLFAACLLGAVRACWRGRENFVPARRGFPWQFRVVYQPHGPPPPAAPPRPEGRKGKLAYTDQLLSETVFSARRRVGLLEALDARLRKPASSRE